MDSRQEALTIMQALSEAGYEALFVGGAVRDSLLGLEPKDYDIGTNATPAQVKEVIATLNPIGFKYVLSPEAEKFNRALTSLVSAPSGEVMEVTTYRSELYGDNRADIMATPADSFYDDSMRRDLTINALGETEDGEIIDYHGGLEDLQNRIVRTVGNPDDRFQEDPLRIIRAIRFSVKYGFSIDSETYESIVKNKDLIPTLSARRLRDEIGKVLFYPEGFTILMETGVLPTLMPEFRDLKQYEHNLQYHPEGNVYNHYIKAFRTWTKLPTRTELGGWALLFHDVAKPETAEWKGQFHTYYGHDKVGEQIILERYNNETGPFEFSRKELKSLGWTTRYHLMKFWEMKKPLKVAEMGNSEHFPLLLEVVYGDSMGDHDEDMAARILEIEEITKSVNDKKEKVGKRDKSFALKVRDELGLQGAEIGKALSQIEEMLSAGIVSSYDEALEVLKSKNLESEENKISLLLPFTIGILTTWLIFKTKPLSSRSKE